MEMKQYLVDTFRFNDRANKQVLAKMRELPDHRECTRLFSHLINSQDKWMARIVQYPQDPGMHWWEPVYPSEDLESQWGRSLRAWIDFLEGRDEKSLFEEAKFIGFNGKHWSAPLKDIALQLNYHSIHHRAQMQWLIRQQGIAPDFVDYIGTAYRQIG